MDKRIVIEIIPHKDQRMPGLGGGYTGDYFSKDGTTYIKCSDLGDDHLSYLIGLHELSEILSMDKHGISMQSADDFDSTWKPHDGITEPGFDSKAPYNCEHIVADFIESFQCREMGYSWEEYERACNEVK